jgi:WD40 repeat protein
MQNTKWEDRIAAANQEKSTTEDTRHGFFVKSLMVDFFVSESVIPERCKVYKKGRITSYDLKGIDEYDLVVKEIFQIKHSTSLTNFKKINLSDIKNRLQALWLILEHNPATYTGTAKSIYTYALLGAIASLFSALVDHPQLSNLINLQYKKLFRKFAFHFNTAFIKQGLGSLIQLGRHFYEHCREELVLLHAFEKLSTPVSKEERLSPEFKNRLLCCLNLHSAFYEYNKSVVKNLAVDKAELDAAIVYLKKNPHTYCQGQRPTETSVAMCGNAIGLLVANLSANTMSLLKNRTYSEEPLCQAERKVITVQYGQFVQIGTAFRHNRMLYTALPESFGIKLIQEPQRQILKAPEKSLTALTPTLFQPITMKGTRNPHQMSLNVHIDRYTCLWGILPNGRLACTNDAETLQLLSVSDGNRKQMQTLSLNPVISLNEMKQIEAGRISKFLSNYFRHACAVAPLILLNNNKMVIGAYQYLHIIDIDPDSPEPEMIIVLKNGGATKLLELDDHHFAVGDGTGNVTIIDSRSAQSLQTLKCPATQGHLLNPVSALALLPKNRLAVGYNEGSIAIWDLSNRGCEMVLKIEDDPDYILSLMSPQSNNASQIEPSVQQGGTPRGGLSCLAVSAEGNLYAGYGNKNIYLWDLSSQQPVKSFIGHTDWPYCLKALPDGSLLSTGGDKTLRLWSKDSCHRTVELSHAGESIEILRDKIIVADHKISSTFLRDELNHGLKNAQILR